VGLALVVIRVKWANRFAGDGSPIPMTIQPKNMNEFFDALGEGYIRRALINGEFVGATKLSAKEWLESREKNTIRFDRRLAMLLTLLGVGVALGLGLAKLAGVG
jgi:hypothetical protein